MSQTELRKYIQIIEEGVAPKVNPGDLVYLNSNEHDEFSQPVKVVRVEGDRIIAVMLDSDDNDPDSQCEFEVKDLEPIRNKYAKKFKCKYEVQWDSDNNCADDRGIY